MRRWVARRLRGDLTRDSERWLQHFPTEVEAGLLEHEAVAEAAAVAAPDEQKGTSASRRGGSSIESGRIRKWSVRSCSAWSGTEPAETRIPRDD